MSKGLFVTGTGTDVGKTYITALIAKKMKDYGHSIGYYKTALSGADSISQSDAGYVNKIAELGQEEDTLLSYIYKNPISPHLASKIEGNPLELSKVSADYNKVCDNYEYVLVEGSGGIVCPIRYDEKKIMLEDIVKALNIPVLIIASAGLGTINATVLTVKYIQNVGIKISGIILNEYKDAIMEKDNAFMIEEITGISVIAKVYRDSNRIEISEEELLKLW